jgi:microcystin-dependent protein
MANPTNITAPKSAYFVGETIVVTMGTPSPGVFHTWSWGRGTPDGMGAGETLIDPVGTTFSRDTSTYGELAQKFGRVYVTITLDTWATNPNPDGIFGNGDDNYTEANLIGSRALSFVVYPNAATPAITSLGLTEGNPAVTAAAIGGYVQGVSLLTWDITATGANGVDIASWELEVDGRIYRTKTGTTTPLEATGTVTVTARVTDITGRTATTTQDIAVLAYSPPKVTSFQAFRSISTGVADDNGSYGRLSFAATVSSLVVGTEQNVVGATIKTRPRGTTTWSTRYTASNLGLAPNAATTADNILANTAYEVRLDLFDKLTAVAAVTFISKGGVLLDLGEGTMGVGKEWQQGTLDVGGDVYADGKAIVSGDLRHRSGALVEHPGMVTLTARATPPTGWLLCDGAAISRTTYADLFTAIGTNYGAGNGTSTFNVPNLKGRFPVGRDSAQAEFNVLGESGGAKAVTLTAEQSGVPEHYHSVRAMGNATPAGTTDGFARGSGSADASFRSGGVASGSAYGSSTGARDASQAHENLPPYLVMNFIIKV